MRIYSIINTIIININIIYSIINAYFSNFKIINSSKEAGCE